MMLSTGAFAAPPAQTWVASWGAAPLDRNMGPAEPNFQNATVRNLVRTSIAGKSLRVRFTNEFGTEPLRIEAAHVAVSAGNGSTQPGTDHALAFNGQPSVVIPPGAFVLSDDVPMATTPFTELAISTYIPAQQISTATKHEDAQQTNYVAPGNDVAAQTLPSPIPVQSWYFLKGVDVEADPGSEAVVAFGDSITDGYGSTESTNHRWPDFLATRLQADPATKHLSVIDEGIGGNRVLRDGTGPSALARFDRDVIAAPGVKYVIILESLNDIGRLAYPDQPLEAVTAADLEQGLAQLVARAHEHGIKVFGATITPYEGAGYYSAAGEQVREAVNQWIRSGGTFDGVVDFDKAVADPAHPNKFLPGDQHGDWLHPNDAGYKVMGDAIDLKLFTR